MFSEVEALLMALGTAQGPDPGSEEMRALARNLKTATARSFGEVLAEQNEDEWRKHSLVGLWGHDFWGCWHVRQWKGHQNDLSIYLGFNDSSSNLCLHGFPRHFSRLWHYESLCREHMCQKHIVQQDVTLKILWGCPFGGDCYMYSKLNSDVFQLWYHCGTNHVDWSGAAQLKKGVFNCFEDRFNAAFETNKQKSMHNGFYIDLKYEWNYIYFSVLKDLGHTSRMDYISHPSVDARSSIRSGWARESAPPWRDALVWRANFGEVSPAWFQTLNWFMLLCRFLNIRSTMQCTTSKFI